MFSKENTTLPDNIGRILIGVYIVFSFVFIVISIYNNLKLGYGDYRFSQGANQGYTQAVNEVIQKSQECVPFPVYSGRTKDDVIGVELINISCLQKTGNAENPQTEETEQ